MVARWLAVLIYVGALFVFSTSSASSAGSMGGGLAVLFPFLSAEQLDLLIVFLRKSGHIVAYFLGTFVFYGATKGTKGLSKYALPTAAAFSLLLASLDEYYQSLLPHRSGQLLDVLIDGVGILMAILIIKVVIARRSIISSDEESYLRREINGKD